MQLSSRAFPSSVASDAGNRIVHASLLAGRCLFIQYRVCREGRIFRIYKFRTITFDSVQSAPGLTKSGDRYRSCPVSCTAEKPAEEHSVHLHAAEWDLP